MADSPLEILVELRASTIEAGMHPLNEASQMQLREWIRPTCEEELEKVRTAWSERALEARGELSTALGLFRMGETEGLELRLQRALDRLDRIVGGEDYLERWAAFSDQHPGAVNFSLPPEEALPPDRQLRRFVNAQSNTFDTALAELREGKKETHWMWFIFPQLAALGQSKKSKFFGIASLAEAKEYIAHGVLGPRLCMCAEALLSLEGKTAEDIFGEVDAAKLRSCVTLFELAAPQEPAFGAVIDRYFGGEPDEKTIEQLNC